jgi:XRE family transcriptional regulator, regulator of sulfur utilization
VSVGSVSKGFGASVKRRRLALGFSQERLAELSKLHPTYIGMIERGLRNPTLDAADKIAVGLNMDLSDLISESAPIRKPRKGQDDEC